MENARRGGQVVRRRSRKPKIAGSNPVRAYLSVQVITADQIPFVKLLYCIPKRCSDDDAIIQAAPS